MELTNLVDFDDLSSPNEEGSKFELFLEEMKGDVLKGAYFIRKNDGRYAFGCTEESKMGQERLLYHLRKTIQFYIDNYPDFDEMKETAELLEVSEEEIVEAMYDLEDDDE